EAVRPGGAGGGTVGPDGPAEVHRGKPGPRPEQPPARSGAAVSEQTARWFGGWADGLITVAQKRDTLERLIRAFREGGGEGKPAYLQVHLSYAPDAGEALEIAHEQWRSNVFSPPLCWDLELPEHFDVAARHVRPEDMHESVLISSDLERFVAGIAEFAALGFEAIYLHHVGVEQRRFIEAFGERVLPAFAKRSAP